MVNLPPRERGGSRGAGAARACGGSRLQREGILGAGARAADAGAKGKNYALNDFDALTRDLMGAVGSNPQ